MNLFSRLSELPGRLFSTGEISPKNENKYSKSEYGSVSRVFQLPKLSEQKKVKIARFSVFYFQYISQKCRRLINYLCKS
jgi:hypothetical protein